MNTPNESPDDDLETQLRRTMREHEIEAPTEVPVAAQRPRSHRSRWFLPLAAAVVIVVIIGAVAVARSAQSSDSPSEPISSATATAVSCATAGCASSPRVLLSMSAQSSQSALTIASSIERTSASTTVGSNSAVGGSSAAKMTDTLNGVSAACPAAPPKESFAGGVTHLDVPAKPTAGRADRLVPDQPVMGALLCQYGPDAGDRKSRRLTGDLSPITDELSWLPQFRPGMSTFCTSALSKQTNYLLRVESKDGTVTWVSNASEVNHCVRTSNGIFISSVNIGPALKTAMDNGTWPSLAEQTKDPCGAWGRIGQDKLMVPAGVTGADICFQDGKVQENVYVDAAHLERLIDLLNSPVAQLADGSCDPTANPHSPGPIYSIAFHFAKGTNVLVSAHQYCLPSLYNFSLKASGSPQVFTELAMLMKTGAPVK